MRTFAAAWSLASFSPFSASARRANSRRRRRAASPPLPPPRPARVARGDDVELGGFCVQVRVGRLGPLAQRRGRGGGAGGEGTEEGDGRPPADPLAAGPLLLALDGLAGVREDALEEGAVVGREVVGELLVLALGEVGLGLEVVADVAPAALDEVGREARAVGAVPFAREVVREVEERAVEKAEDRPERLFLAAVRGGRDEDEVAVFLLGEAADEGVALVASAAGDQLGGDEAGLDRLPDADVVGDEEPHRVELERHEERDELVGARLDGDGAEGAERPGAGAEAEADRVAQEAARAEVAEARRVGQRELRRLDGLERREDPRDFFLGAAEGAKDEEVVDGVREDDPFTAAGGDEGADGERHRSVPSWRRWAAVGPPAESRAS